MAYTPYVPKNRALGGQPVKRPKTHILDKPAKPATSDVQATQPVQPGPTDVKATTMNKAALYTLGQTQALVTLGIDKTAAAAAPLGFFGGAQKLYQAARGGWGSEGFARGLAGKAKITGLTGAMHNVGHEWSNIAKKSPGVAAGLVAAPALGAGYMMGGGTSGGGDRNINIR